MSRLPKFLLIFVLLVFVLACNMVTQPFNDAQNVVETAQSFATAMPLETLQSLATNMPVETLQAFSSAVPDLENMFDPQGTPVTEWNGIPIMSQATAGQEFVETKSYSFRASVTTQEVQDYYNTELVKLGWSSAFSLPGDSSGAIMVFSKDSSLLTITITSSDGSVVVVLTLA